MSLGKADWGALAGILSPEQLDGLQEDYEAFVGRTGNADRDLFVQYLYQQGSIDEAQLAQALRIRLRPELTDVRQLEERARGGGEAARTFATMSPAGHYALLGAIGVGAMGQVWVAKDHDLKRKVAYKELGGQYLKQPIVRQRFVAEAQITAQLDHPNVPPVYGLEVGAAGRLGYAMKLVEGRTLREWLSSARQQARARRRPSVPLAERLEWFLKICDAVSYAHSRGVIHRDLKPDNVMIGPFGEVWVMDWGLARVVGSAELDAAASSGTPDSPDAGVTRAGETVGTPAYMSPEQARGEREKLGPLSDQYALGLLLQELVTLVPPTGTLSARDALQAAARAQRQPIGRGHPRAMRAIVARACAAEPPRRYPSVAHLASDVRRYLRDEPVQALREGLLRGVWRAMVRHREWVLAAGFGVLIFGVVLAMASVTLLVADRWSAAARQERLGAGVARIGEQAHRIDKEILRYERRLEVAAGAATQLLVHVAPDPEVVLYRSEDFASPATAPPDLAPNPRLGRPTSLDSPVVQPAPGVDPLVVTATGGRLVRLVSELQRQLGPNAAPLGWTYVGTTSGVHFSWPGHGGLAPDFDPRERPWYRQALGSAGLVWGAPYLDASGLGLVVPCSRALRGPGDELLGVAGLDVPLSHVIDDMLAPAGLPIREAWLLDGQGRVLVRSSERERATDDPQLFSEPEVVARAREGRFASVRRSGDTWWLLYPLASVGWSYLVEADERALLGE